MLRTGCTVQSDILLTADRAHLYLPCRGNFRTKIFAHANLRLCKSSSAIIRPRKSSYALIFVRDSSSTQTFANLRTQIFVRANLRLRISRKYSSTQIFVPATFVHAIRSSNYSSAYLCLRKLSSAHNLVFDTVFILHTHASIRLPVICLARLRSYSAICQDLEISRNQAILFSF